MNLADIASGWGFFVSGQTGQQAPKFVTMSCSRTYAVTNLVYEYMFNGFRIQQITIGVRDLNVNGFLA